jgi:photosystem II stability/assembly factor-like uncharacterized protein
MLRRKTSLLGKTEAIFSNAAQESEIPFRRLMGYGSGKPSKREIHSGEGGQGQLRESSEEAEGMEVIRDRVRDYLRRHGIDRNFDANQRLQAVRQEYEIREAEKAKRSLHTDPAAVAGTNWVSLGPTNGAGRMTAIAVHPTIAGTIYVGAAGGGVWKTTNGGNSWTPLTESITDLFVGAVAIARSSPNVIYVGTGEGNTGTPGIGLLKSTDGGTSWLFPAPIPVTFRSFGLSFYKISVHPTNPQELIIGTSQGGYRSTDGGNTWTNVIPWQSDASVVREVTDIVRNPTNPQILYATTNLPEILKSTDAGATWTSKSNGVQSATLGRLSIAISASNPSVLYVAGAATYSDTVAHIYKTVDGGESWSELAGISNNSTHSIKYFFVSLNDQSSYDNTIVISPSDPNVVIAGGVEYVRSTDGGASWTHPFDGVHVDAHDLQYQGSTLYVANDGGIWSSTNDAQTATDRNTGLVTRQYYTVTNDPINRNRVFGGSQDNGTDRRPDSSGTNWAGMLGGDGFDCAVNPYAPEIFYGTIQYGEIYRTTNAGTAAFFKRISPNYPSGERSPFATALTIDPNNPSVLYTGTYRPWKSSDGGNSWAPMSTATTDGSTWGRSNLVEVAIAPSDSRILMAVTDNFDPSIFRSTNGGMTWVGASGVINVNSLPDVNDIEIDPKNPSVAYAATRGKGSCGYIVFMTTDGGASWTCRGSGLPSSFSAHVVRVDPTDSNVLFCGTDVGVYRSVDKGLNWTKFGTGLPSVSVYDLKILDDGSALRAATHGRGMWELQIPPSGNNPPSATINNLTSNVVTKGASVNFQGAVSDPDNGDSATGVWFFGDGGEVINSGSGAISATHVFSRAGVFTVSLNARDSHGALGSAYRTIYVVEGGFDNCGSPTACVTPPPGLVAWWRAEGNALDQTGLNNGMLINSMTFGAGRVCGGFLGGYLGNDISNGVVEVPDSASLALNRSITLEGWLKLESYGGWVIQRLDDGSSGNLSDSYAVTIGYSGTLYFDIGIGSRLGTGISSPSPLPLNQFVHFAATLDDATNQIKLYINGSLVSQFTMTQRPYDLDPNAKPRVKIGNINGITDELSLYNRALTSAEIQAIYNAGTAATGATGKCLSSVPMWEAVVLSTAQTEIKNWTTGGRTYAYLKLLLPNSGYRVTNWGSAASVGNDFTADAAVEKFTGASVQAMTTTAQIYDLGPLANGTYNFNFKTSGTLAKTLQFSVSSTVPPPNPIDNAREFVKQQYRDFLNREADPAGENFWTDNITKCSDPARRPTGQTEAQCTLRQRETTSGAFFLSPEFQYTGYFVYRMYQGGLGRQPKLSEFIPDAEFVGSGIVINGQLSAAKINQNKAAFAALFVNCSDATKYRCAEFKAIYDGLNNQQYVDKLFLTTGVNASASDRTALVNGLNGGTETRATVLQKAVDGVTVLGEGNQQFTTTYGQAFYNSEFNRAFVQLEYFGYMKRDPDDAGYAFWLGKLNQFSGNFVNAEMVLAFISSPEYRARFGQP